VHLFAPFLAADIDDQRRADAARHAIASQRRSVAGRDRLPVRRRLALVLAAISRTSAGAVRRLDACLADDLAGRFATSR
jgi:hypothetical protein